MAQPPPIDNLREQGDISRDVTQDDVNRVYAQVYQFMEKEYKAAQAEGKPVKFLVGDRHYIPNPDPADTTHPMTADSDDVTVGLCAMDAARRLGIRDFTLEWDKPTLDKLSPPEMVAAMRDEVSFKHYLDFAGKNKIKFGAGDPGGNEISDEEIINNMSDEQVQQFGKLLQEGKTKEADAYFAQALQKINARREGQMTGIIDDKTPGLSIVGAEHLPGLTAALAGKYHVAPIVCFSSTNGEPTPGQQAVEDMVKAGKATRFVVDGRAVFLIGDDKGRETLQRSNLRCIDMVQAAAAGFATRQAGVSNPENAQQSGAPIQGTAPKPEGPAAPPPPR